MLLLALVLSQLAAPDLNPAELTRVRAGEVVVRSATQPAPDGEMAGLGVGAIAIAGSMEATWKVISNYHDKLEYQPNLSRCDILQEEGGKLHIRMVVKTGLVTVTYTEFIQCDAAGHSLHWVLDHGASGNSMKELEGEMDLQPLGPDQTLLYYRTQVEPGRFVPGFLQRYLVKNGIPDLLAAIKHRVEKR